MIILLSSNYNDSHAPATPPVKRWLSLEWNAEPEPGTVRVLLRHDSPGREEMRRRLQRDEMTQPFLFETGGERRLHLSWGCVQSTLLRHDPRALVAQYTRKMMAFLLVNPTPRRLLMLGLGGGELVRFCHHRLPRTDITVVEVDPDVIALRDEFCIPPDDRRFRIIQDDGAQYMHTLGEPVDAILVDAFDRRGVAPSLATDEFHAAAAAALTPAGVLAMNFWGAPERFVSNLHPARRAFGGNLRLVTVPNGNLVLFAASQSLPSAWTAALGQRATRLKQVLQLDFPHYLRRMCQAESCL